MTRGQTLGDGAGDRCSFVDASLRAMVSHRVVLHASIVAMSQGAVGEPGGFIGLDGEDLLVAFVAIVALAWMYMEPTEAAAEVLMLFASQFLIAKYQHLVVEKGLFDSGLDCRILQIVGQADAAHHRTDRWGEGCNLYTSDRRAVASAVRVGLRSQHQRDMQD